MAVIFKPGQTSELTAVTATVFEWEDMGPEAFNQDFHRAAGHFMAVALGPGDALSLV
ncbi:MAG: hypothetical protein ACRD06_09085 [Terriglobia bacterium]